MGRKQYSLKHLQWRGGGMKRVHPVQAALLATLFLITVLVIMSGGDGGSGEEGFGCYHYCSPTSSASCLDNRNHLHPAEVEEKGHLLHQPTEDQHVWTAEPFLLWQSNGCVVAMPSLVMGAMLVMGGWGLIEHFHYILEIQWPVLCT